MPWVSFCISTYRRPEVLSRQLKLLQKQTFSDFEVVISDNDTEFSAKPVVENLNDPRFKYFANFQNIGMIKSFNKSIERSCSEFVVMVTDDDPVEPEFLSIMFDLYVNYPGYSIYAGFERRGKPDLNVEIIRGKDFLTEILDPGKTGSILWSSSVMRKCDALKIGNIPDYGSPHLADHAFTALTGSIQGGVIINKLFSFLSSHDSNFSKFNFHYYVDGCKGFYDTILNTTVNSEDKNIHIKITRKHLGKWFIATMFSARRYYTLNNKDDSKLNEINLCCKRILDFSFMKVYRLKYRIKRFIFFIKNKAGLLKYF